MDAVYEEELKWAEKIRSKTLTKKEKKMFWKQHSIIDARSKFRTFSSPEEDLIPHSNPLLTDETCLAPKSKDVTQEIFWKAGKGGYVSPFGSPFNMQPMAPCFNPINIKSETNTI